MDLNTIIIAGVLLVAVVIFFAVRNKRDARKMMAENTNVLPLMQQKAMQIKVSRLQEATQNNIAANEQLVQLAGAYKSNTISMQEYNEKLDAMIYNLDIEL